MLCRPTGTGNKSRNEINLIRRRRLNCWATIVPVSRTTVVANRRHLFYPQRSYLPDYLWRNLGKLKFRNQVGTIYLHCFLHRVTFKNVDLLINFMVFLKIVCLNSLQHERQGQKKHVEVFNHSLINNIT